jgi:hypothetical protein
MNNEEAEVLNHIFDSPKKLVIAILDGILEVL